MQPDLPHDNNGCRFMCQIVQWEASENKFIGLFHCSLYRAVSNDGLYTMCTAFQSGFLFF